MKSMCGPSPPVNPTLPLGKDGDVTYPYFLINGGTTADPQVKSYRAGQRVRRRIINAGADTGMRVAVPGSVMTVAHTDGYPVVPRRTDAVILAWARGGDAIITVRSSVPVVAAAEGKDGYAQLNVRVNGRRQGDVADVKTLRAPGERVRLRFISQSMMFHSFDLHGPSFQWCSPAEPALHRAPARTRCSSRPFRRSRWTSTPTNPGRWIVHCHNDYHLDGGMATLLKYAG